MPEMAHMLLIALALPLLGAAIVLALSPLGQTAVRQSALVTSLLVLAVVGVLVVNFPGGAAPYAVTETSWMGPGAGIDVQLRLGLDGLSLWLVALSALLVLTSVLVSWDAIDERPASFYGLLLLLETGMLGVFAARDIIVFYIFFEFTLIPLFFLIGVWGSEERRYAAIKFFLFTLAGSVLTFLGLLVVVLWNASHGSTGMMTFSIEAVTHSLASLAVAGEGMPAELQVWIFLALFAGFAIKVPLFPLHTWLPLAHVQAPTAGSVLLAGILLKLGTYGFLRLAIPWLPEATVICMPYLLGLSLAGILYGALVALAQADMKRLIAYSSVSHLGFCMLGLFALNRLGIQGGTLQMINHGLSTGGLFACVGLLYDRYHTREIARLGGVARTMPRLTFFMLVFTMSSIGLPGLNGFAGEFLILLGMFQRAWQGAPPELATSFVVIAVLAVLGVVLGAWYMLWLVERVFFGPQGETGHDPVCDLSPRECLALAPLVVPIVWIGIQPGYILDTMSPTLDRLTNRAQQTYEARYGLAADALPPRLAGPPRLAAATEGRAEEGLP